MAPLDKVIWDKVFLWPWEIETLVRRQRAGKQIISLTPEEDRPITTLVSLTYFAGIGPLSTGG